MRSQGQIQGAHGAKGAILASPGASSPRDMAYEAIKNRIITCEFRPGECLNEGAVSSLIGVGRAVVHHALDRLMSEDMVKVIPRKGFIVKPVSLEDVTQLIDVRLINEVECARLAAVHAEKTHLQHMTKILGLARKAILERDVHAMMSLDREFHLSLAAAGNNWELAGVLRKLNERSLRFWFICFTKPDHHRQFQRHHEEIFEAVRKHDAEAASASMAEHIEAFRRSVVSQL